MESFARHWSTVLRRAGRWTVASLQTQELLQERHARSRGTSKCSYTWLCLHIRGDRAFRTKVPLIPLHRSAQSFLEPDPGLPAEPLSRLVGGETHVADLRLHGVIGDRLHRRP